MLFLQRAVSGLRLVWRFALSDRTASIHAACAAKSCRWKSPHDVRVSRLATNNYWRNLLCFIHICWGPVLFWFFCPSPFLKRILLPPFAVISPLLKEEDGCQNINMWNVLNKFGFVILSCLFFTVSGGIGGRSLQRRTCRWSSSLFSCWYKLRHVDHWLSGLFSLAHGSRLIQDCLIMLDHRCSNVTFEAVLTKLACLRQWPSAHVNGQTGRDRPDVKNHFATFPKVISETFSTQCHIYCVDPSPNVHILSWLPTTSAAIVIGYEIHASYIHLIVKNNAAKCTFIRVRKKRDNCQY